MNTFFTKLWSPKSISGTKKILYTLIMKMNHTSFGHFLPKKIDILPSITQFCEFSELYMVSLHLANSEMVASLLLLFFLVIFSLSLRGGNFTVYVSAGLYMTRFKFDRCRQKYTITCGPQGLWVRYCIKALTDTVNFATLLSLYLFLIIYLSNQWIYSVNKNV